MVCTWNCTKSTSDSKPSHRRRITTCTPYISHIALVNVNNAACHVWMIVSRALRHKGLDSIIWFNGAQSARPSVNTFRIGFALNLYPRNIKRDSQDREMGIPVPYCTFPKDATLTSPLGSVGGGGLNRAPESWEERVGGRGLN